MRLVVDASVAIKWLLDEVGSPHAHHFLGRFQTGEDELIAPDVVAAVLADFLRIGLPTRSAAETAQRTLELALGRS